VAEIADAGGSARFVALDLCSADAIDRCAQEALATPGGIGIVVNVAG